MERGTEAERVKIAAEKTLKTVRLEAETDTVRVERALLMRAPCWKPRGSNIARPSG